MERGQIHSIVEKQREFFDSGATLSVEKRIEYLKKIKAYIIENEGVITTAMGFGGVGESGMGQYHGKDGFDTFTHYTSIVDKKTWIDLGQRYQPYNKVNIWFSRNMNFGSTIHTKLESGYKLLPGSFNELIGLYFRNK